MTEKLNADAEKTNSGNPEVASLEAMADKFDPDKAHELQDIAREQIADDVQEKNEETKDSLNEDDESKEKGDSRQAEIVVNNIRSALNTIRPAMEQLMAMTKGSMQLEQASATLLQMNQKMSELSAQYADILQNVQDIESVHQFGANYQNEMDKSFGYSTAANKAIHDRAFAIPPQLGRQMLFLSQQINENLNIINGMVHNKGNATTTSADQKAQYEAENREIDKNNPQNRNLGSISSVVSGNF